MFLNGAAMCSPSPCASCGKPIGRFARAAHSRGKWFPSTEHVTKKRHHTRRRLRFLSLSLVVVGTVFAGWGFFSAATTQE